MPLITLPDKTKKEIKDPLSIEELASELSTGLGRSVIAGKVNGILVDASEKIYKDCRVQILTSEDARNWSCHRRWLLL